MGPSSHSQGQESVRNISQAQASAFHPSSSPLARGGTTSHGHTGSRALWLSPVLHTRSSPSLASPPIESLTQRVFSGWGTCRRAVSAAKASRGRAGADPRKTKGSHCSAHSLPGCTKRFRNHFAARHSGCNDLQNRPRSLLMFNDNKYKINYCGVLRVCSDRPRRYQ